ncbi:unnamed protein product [Anisakis simplex]|uniref:ABC transporter domain-containing protein n=1 Tax=Anisakis simplex TaxID=6269 RepID=A0A0M3JR98_ANISI|nr:unnamed protein product [Anisakis simplex]
MANDNFMKAIENLHNLKALVLFTLSLYLVDHFDGPLSMSIRLFSAYLSVLSAWLWPTVLAFSCIVGLSMFLAAVSDLITLLTVHMLCFHVYSTRLVVSFIRHFCFVTERDEMALSSHNGNDSADERTSLLAKKRSSLNGENYSNISSSTSSNTTLTADYGGTTITSVLTELGSFKPVTLAWQNICVTINKSNKNSNSNRFILDNVSGVAKCGHLTALMGASGAGKTTLLNTLMVRNLKGLTVEGHVTVNGRELGERITSVSGYVQQDELFVSTLTVREHLNLQAKLRLPSEFTSEKRSRRVYQVMCQLGLIKCQNTSIGAPGIKKGISGGEAKRLAFASELLNNPAVLFCDEPTTGLDSFMAESVVKVLSKLAHSGRTIFCTIHQPASELFHLFDRVLFLACGRTAFIGSPGKALAFFEQCGYRCRDDYNPADMIIETLAIKPHEETFCEERIQQICATFNDSTLQDEINSELKDSETIGDYPIAHKKASLQMQVSTTPKTTILMIMMNIFKSFYMSSIIFFVTCLYVNGWLISFCLQCVLLLRRFSSNGELSALLNRSFLDNLRNPSLARAKISQKIVIVVVIIIITDYEHFVIVINRFKVGITNINGALFFLVCEFTYGTLYGVLNFLPADFPLLAREYHDGMYGIAPYYFSRCLSYLPLFTIDGVLLLLISYWMIGLQSSVGHVFLAVLIGLLIEQSAAAFGVMLRCGFEAFAINQWSDVAGAGCYLGDCDLANSILAEFSFSKDDFVLDLALLAMLFYYTIASLWRVFRGRKYNPLRQRVDSVQLDSRQLFIATLFLSALIFMAPTVLVYFVVFSTLRFTVIGTKRFLESMGQFEDRLIIRIVSL